MSIQLSGLSIEQTKEIIPEGTILLGYVGSISHNTYVPKNDPNSIDDKDVMGVCILPLSEYFGLERDPKLKGKRNVNNEQQEVQQGEWDVVIYEIKKYIKLLLQQNPNVISLLWLRDNHYIHISELGRLLIENRDIFISKCVYKSFTGYAYNQLHKMENFAFEGYMGAKRKELVEKFSYDTKNAAHLIRLLKMGIEFLTEKKLNVFRHDAEELKSIKRGEWPLDRVKQEAERLFVLAQEAFVRSTLPDEPDYKRAEELLMKIQRKFHAPVS